MDAEKNPRYKIILINIMKKIDNVEIKSRHYIIEPETASGLFGNNTPKNIALVIGCCMGRVLNYIQNKRRYML